MKLELHCQPHELSQMNGITFRRLICQAFGCSKPKPNAGFRTLLVEPDEKIPKPMARIDLTKPLKPGFRRPISLTVDEAVDKREDGSFAKAEVIEGDSTVSIRPESTETQIKAYLNGDGATGNKVVRLTADGHIGEGDVPISIDIGFTVAHPDATAFGPVTEDADEPIPA